MLRMVIQCRDFVVTWHMGVGFPYKYLPRPAWVLVFCISFFGLLLYALILGHRPWVPCLFAPRSLPKYVEMSSRSSSPLFSVSSSSFVQSVKGPSSTVEVVDPRHPIVDCHSSSPGVEVLSLSSRGATPMDYKVLKALMVMKSYYNSDSTIMVRRLAEVRNRFYFPKEFELHVPLPGQCPYDVSSDGFRLQ
ncbi:hypothetical protein BHM03_00009065 [Ensete ventricosum]|nr:hypothetical protein BHM03_00009065 [Ensete ventricosum]